MEQSLWNDDLIRQLCSQHDSTLDKLPTSGLGQSFDSSLGGKYISFFFFFFNYSKQLS